MSSNNKKFKQIFFYDVTAADYRSDNGFRLFFVIFFLSEIVLVILSQIDREKNILFSSSEVQNPKLFWSGAWGRGRVP